MRNTNLRKILFWALALLLSLACSQIIPATPQPPATLDVLYTSAAQTLNAMATQGAVALTSQPPTASPTVTLSIPTSTVVELATFTSVPPVTKCDAAAFVSDVTYPDGSNVGANVVFTKIWRIRNVGTCSWTPSYALVFVSGDRLGAPSFVVLPGNVAPGQSVDIPVQLTAPSQTGRFKGNWKLRNASGILFGFGSSGDQNIFVDISVSGYVVSGYEFLDKVCEAEWQTGSQSLPCPGADGDSRGFVFVQSPTKMEDGASQSKGLITHPEQVRDGFITGKYPAITIQSGDRFQAWINCLNKADSCDVVFKLQYQIGKGAVQTLGQWREVYEGRYYPVNIDLSALSGEKVKLILTVLANGSAHEDYAQWIAPRLTRLSSQPPTATFTPTRTATVTATATATVTPSRTPTVTATGSPTSTATPTFTPSATGTATITATPTATGSPTSTSTATATATATETPTPTSTP